jgi:hypothetical protein
MDIDNRQDVRRYQDAPDALDIQAQEDVISAAPTYTREPPQGSTPGSVFKCKSDAACCNTVMMCDPCSSGTKPCESAPGRWSAMRLHTLVSPTWVMKGLLSANPPHTSSLLPLAKVEVLVPAPSCPGSASTLDVARIGFELAGAPSGHFGSVAIEGCVTNACVVQDQLVESKTSSLLVISVKGKESYYPFYLHTKTGQNTLFGVDWMTTWWGAPRILVRLDHSMGQGITIHDNTQTLVPIRLHKMPSTDLSATKASQIHLISMIPSQLCMDRSTVAGASHCLSDHPVHVFSPGASKDAILASPSYFGAHSYYPEEDAAALDSGVIAVLGRDDETNCQRDFCSPVFEGASTSIHIWDPTTNVAKIHELAVSTPQTTPSQRRAGVQRSGTLAPHQPDASASYVESAGAAEGAAVTGGSGKSASKSDIFVSSSAISVALSQCSGFRPLATAVVSSDSNTA